MPTPGLLKSKHKNSTNKQITRFVCETQILLIIVSSKDDQNSTNKETRFVCETQIPLIMASSKDDQDQNTNILRAVDKLSYVLWKL